MPKLWVVENLDLVTLDLLVNKARPSLFWFQTKGFHMSSLCIRDHIRPKCYDLLYPEPTIHNNVKTKAIWVKKSDLRSAIGVYITK